MLLAKDAAEAHPRGKVVGVDAEAGAEDLFGLRQLAVFAKLLGERKEKSALRIGLDPELQFLDFGSDAGLRHVLKVRILLNNSVAAQPRPQKRTAPGEGGGSQFEQLDR